MMWDGAITKILLLCTEVMTLICSVCCNVIWLTFREIGVVLKREERRRNEVGREKLND